MFTLKSFEIGYGVFNLDSDEHNKLSMKGSYFVLIDGFRGFPRALVVRVIMTVLLERLINQTRARS